MAGFESIGESGRYEVDGRMVRFAVASALKDGVSDEEAVSELLGRWLVRAVGGFADAPTPFADADGAIPDDVRKRPQMTATDELRLLLDNHRRNSPTYDCMTCSHATVNDWKSRNVTCGLTGTSGKCMDGWCMSYKPRVPHDVVRLARRKVRVHD